MATIPALSNVADGDALSPAKWNTDVVAAEKFLLRRPAAKVRNTTDRVIGGGAFASSSSLHYILLWPSKVWDTEADYFGATPMWTTGDNTRLYIRTTGVYYVAAQVEAYPNTTSTGWIALWLRRNATTWGTGVTLNANRGTPDPDNSTTLLVTTEDLFVAGDYIDVVFTQTSPANMQLYNATYSNYLLARMVATQ